MIGKVIKKKTIFPTSIAKIMILVITSQLLVRLSIVECIPQVTLINNKIPQQISK